MDNRVYGVIGISSIMANWNADFTGYPKTTTKGEVFGSDKALKYPMKKMWEENGEKVLYIKSIKANGEKYNPRTLAERYEQIFGEKPGKNKINILKNLFSAIDVKNFGATFAESEANISITGAVQIGQGYNKYHESDTQVQNILSPFQDPKAKEKNKKKKEAKNTTSGTKIVSEEEVQHMNWEANGTSLGTKIVSDEAHYYYPFTINSLSYNEFVTGMDIKEAEYTEEDYKKFKEAALTSATYFATNSKVGCENEFALFIETDRDLYLPNLDKFIQFEKGEEKNVIYFTGTDLLKSLSNNIKKIEIYYNPYSTTIDIQLDNITFYNIFTNQVINP